MGVQFGNHVNYTLRLGGKDSVDTQVPRIEGWVGFKIEFTGKKSIFHLSLDNGETWQNVGENNLIRKFRQVYLRNNVNGGERKMAAYFDDIRVMDSNGNTVLFEGFGGDEDPTLRRRLSVSAADKLPSVWGRIKASR